MNTVGAIATSLVIGIFLAITSRCVDSKFLMEFLRSNLLLLLPALMAINVTTAGIIMTKLRDLADKFKASFEPTINEVRKSFDEQVILMFVSAILLIVESSRKITLTENERTALEGIICGAFVFALLILFDIARGIFVILRFENKSK